MRRTFSPAFVRVVILLIGSVATTSPLHAQCSQNTSRQAREDVRWLWNGVVDAPRNAVRPQNLKWELPIAAVTGALIASGDTPASRQISSARLERWATRGSNAGLTIELAGAGTAYVFGCAKGRDGVRSTGQTALEAAGAALAFDEFLKIASNRQRPFRANSGGEFWEGGNSFPSGHSAVSFAVASVIGHRVHSPLVKWGVYAMAAGVSLARYPAKEHFFSDILVGGTLGYVTGAYLVSPTGGDKSGPAFVIPAVPR